MAHTATELTWLQYILRDFRISLLSTSILFCDNISALYMTINHVFHAQSKHIKLDYHYVQEHVALGFLVTKHVSSDNQVADIFTKSITKATLPYFQTKLCLQPRLSLGRDIDNKKSA